MTSVYVGNPICGKLGSSASREDMQRNCKIAQEIVRILRAVFSDVDFFAPASTDNIVQRLLMNGKITVDDILEADHQEQKDRDKTLLITWEKSEGVIREHEYAEKIGQDCYWVFDESLSDPEMIVRYLKDIQIFLRS